MTRSSRRPHLRLQADIVDAARLSPGHRERWLGFARQQPLLDTPPFDPEFVCGLAQYVPDCKVAVLRREGGVAGYVAFAQAAGETIARPIPMCDYQPIVLAPGFNPDARELVRALGVRSWRFENVLAPGGVFEGATHMTTARCSRLHAVDGFDAYCAGLRASGRSIKKYSTQIRYLERDHGPVRLLHGVTDAAALQRLLQFKAERYGPDGAFPPWVADALAHVHRQQGQRVEGRLSVLKVGDTEIAYLLCLKIDRLFYYWFPTFDPAFAKYSPGMVALWLLVKDLPELGCNTIDLGPGGESYKAYFANAHIKVASGLVDASPIVAATRKVYRQTEQRLRSCTAMQRLLKPAVTWMRQARQTGRKPG